MNYICKRERRVWIELDSAVWWCCRASSTSGDVMRDVGRLLARYC